MKTPPFLVLAISIGMATMSAGCVTVNGVDVGGVNANASVRANTNVTGNKIGTGTETTAERPSPSTFSASPKPNSTPVPSPVPTATPISGPVQAGADVSAMAAALKPIVQDELDAGLYSIMVEDAVADAGVISGGGGNYRTLYLTQPLGQDVVMKRAERHRQAQLFAQANLNSRSAERDALARALLAAPWVDNGDGTEKKTAEFVTTYASGGANNSRSVRIERVRIKSDKAAVHEIISFSQSQGSETRTSIRTVAIKEDGSEAFAFRSTVTSGGTTAGGGNVIAAGGANYGILAAQATSVEWSRLVPLNSGNISGSGTCTINGKAATVAWAGGTFEPFGTVDLGAGQSLQIAAPLNGSAQVTIGGQGGIISSGSLN